MNDYYKLILEVALKKRKRLFKKSKNKRKLK